jgi:ribosomal protein L11 methylase PrmA
VARIFGYLAAFRKIGNSMLASCSPAVILRRRRTAAALATLLCAPALAQLNLVDSEGRPAGAVEAPFITTPDAIVPLMLDLAGVSASDVVYDLGCGDGRIVIAAGKRGARGVGVDIDEVLIENAKVTARQAGVADRVRFTKGDLFEMDYRDATVVMLYLSERLNLQLLPKLKAQLKPGSRIVSHRFKMGDLKPDRVINIDNRDIYLWRI